MKPYGRKAMSEERKDYGSNEPQAVGAPAPNPKARPIEDRAPIVKSGSILSRNPQDHQSD